MSKKSRIDFEMKEGLIHYFLDLPDPRIDRRKKHLLLDVLVIAICAVICGARGWDDIEVYGRANLDWFKEFLELPHGIPSHDTFARVFARLDPQEFQKCFMAWVQSIRKSLGIPDGGGTIAIDGKTLRRSLNEAAKKSAIHGVNVWAVEERLVLAQLKVDEKSKAARAHWGIENSLHWCLDVAMNEDQSRIRAIHAAENFSLLRKIALNLFKQDRTRKRGIEAKQRNAGWDRNYLLQVLFGSALESGSDSFRA